MSRLPEWVGYNEQQHGWFMAHNALRLDLTDYKHVLEVLSESFQLKTIQPWMGQNLVLWKEHFLKQVHHHHQVEEEITFPFLATKSDIPPKMSADHVELLKLLVEVNLETDEMCQHIQNERFDRGAQVLTKLIPKFDHLDREMREHLKEEEEEGLPLVFACVTRKEDKKLTKKITKGLTKYDMAWFLRPCDDPAKLEFMTREGIPKFVQKFILFPYVREEGKFFRKYTTLLKDIESGTQTDRSTLDKGSLGCCVQ